MLDRDMQCIDVLNDSPFSQLVPSASGEESAQSREETFVNGSDDPRSDTRSVSHPRTRRQLVSDLNTRNPITRLRIVIEVKIARGWMAKVKKARDMGLTRHLDPQTAGRQRHVSKHHPLQQPSVRNPKVDQGQLHPSSKVPG